MAKPERNPFELPAEPRTGLDLIWLVLFEYPRLRAFGKRIGRGCGLLLYLRAVPWIVLLGTVLWLFGLVIVVGLELPLRALDHLLPAYVERFNQHPDAIGRVVEFIALDGPPLAFLMAATLAVGALAFAVGWGVAPGMGVGLTGVSATGLSAGLAVGLAGGSAAGLAVGLAWGLAAGLAWGLAYEILLGLGFGGAIGLASGLTFGLGADVEFGVATGIGAAIGWWLGFLRLPFYAPEAVAALFRLDLRHNPYLRDAGVRLPIWGARRRLTDEARQDPATGSAFADFLLEHRPLQRTLAAEVLHAVEAGRWALQPLEPLALRAPRLVEEAPRFRPSEDWLSDLAELREQLIASQHQTQPSLHRDAHARFMRRLDAFRQRTLAESPRWARHYLPAVDIWRAEAAKELARLEDQARLLEPITANVYRPDDPLRPGTDAELFLGREDLRDELTRAVLTPRELPLLLIQGQRRVGKTSLLNFLQDLLGPGFRVVYQDLQAGKVASVPAWLADLRRRVAEAIGEPPDEWHAPADWLAAWADLEPWLAAAAERAGRRLILAFDEYEALHDYLAAEPARGCWPRSAPSRSTRRGCVSCLPARRRSRSCATRTGRGSSCRRCGCGSITWTARARLRSSPTRCRRCAIRRRCRRGCGN